MTSLEKIIDARAKEEERKYPLLSKIPSAGAIIAFLLILIGGFVYWQYQFSDTPLKSNKGEILGLIVFVVAIIALFASFFLLGAIVKLIKKLREQD